MSETQLPSGALLRATIAQVAPQIAKATNLGQSDDTQDLYYLLDYLSFAVDQAYPQIPCSKGCSHCCKKNVFRVSRVEWERVQVGLNGLAPEARAAALDRAREIYAPHRERLEAIAEYWTRHDNPPNELLEEAMLPCPMLDGGRCGIYADRPAICRAYGYTSAVVKGESRLLICREEGPSWIRHLEDTQVEAFPMPSWNPVQRKIEALNGAGPIKPLPLWLLELAESEANVQAP
ncbi:MAG TPA: YkgJ family cysteine cluster protein [Oscillatoriaceae cyanobacterium]